MALIFGTEPSWALLTIRLALGGCCARSAEGVAGSGGYGLKGTVGYFEFLGIPCVLGVSACFTAWLGGIGVFTRFLTRLAALGLAVQMLVTIIAVRWSQGFFLNQSLTPGKGHGIEFALVLWR